MLHQIGVGQNAPWTGVLQADLEFVKAQAGIERTEYQTGPGAGQCGQIKIRAWFQEDEQPFSGSKPVTVKKVGPAAGAFP